MGYSQNYSRHGVQPVGYWSGIQLDTIHHHALVGNEQHVTHQNAWNKQHADRFPSTLELFTYVKNPFLYTVICIREIMWHKLFLEVDISPHTLFHFASKPEKQLLKRPWRCRQDDRGPSTTPVFSNFHPWQIISVLSHASNNNICTTMVPWVFQGLRPPLCYPTTFRGTFWNPLGVVPIWGSECLVFSLRSH